MCPNCPSDNVTYIDNNTSAASAWATAALQCNACGYTFRDLAGRMHDSISNPDSIPVEATKTRRELIAGILSDLLFADCIHTAAEIDALVDEALDNIERVISLTDDNDD